MSTIPLAKAYDPKKISFPGYLSVKLDGVPVRIDVRTRGDSVFASRIMSRQGKPLPSIDMQAKLLMARAALTFATGDYTFVAEITHSTFTDFKDTSGVVRRHEQSNDLILNIFDVAGFQNMPTFGERTDMLRAVHNCLVCEHIKIVTQMPVANKHEFEGTMLYLLREYPDAEGFVYRAASAEFKPGARHWDYMKIVQDPSMDLRIIGYEQAIDKNGVPKGMVGGMIAEYKGGTIGIGPGKLTHLERTSLWQKYQAAGRIFPPRLAKVQYKRDDSYTALRQPTFQCWRYDKDDVSYD